MKKATHKPKRIIARWRPIAFAALLTFAVLAEFSTASHQPSPRPPDMLLGRWHSKPTQDELYAQFEFVQDGTVVERVLKSDTQRNVKEPPQLDQCATGTFRIIDPMRLEIEVGPLLERECPY
jgi:hypothetical protein